MPVTNPSEVFAQNLTMLRKREGMSQEQLAQQVGLTRQAIFKYERAEINPSMDVIAKLSVALGVRMESFFKEHSEFNLFAEGVKIKWAPSFKYREQRKLEAETDELVKMEAYKFFADILMLEELMNEKVRFVNPIRKLKIGSKQDAENAAIEVRKKWELYNNPIANVVALLEGKGIRVIEVAVDSTFEGLSAIYDDIPFIVLNSNVDEVTRRRFTALHELGHIMLQIVEELSDEEIERICDAFAAAMLLPKELLLLELGSSRTKLSQRELDRIKAKYGISVQAVLVGAAFAKIISWSKYRELKEEDFSQNACKYSVDERATRFEKLLFRGLVEGRIDRETAAQFKGISVSELRELQSELEEELI